MSGYKPDLSDDEERMIAYIRWRAKTTPNIDSQIALEALADDLEKRKHHHDD